MTVRDELLEAAEFFQAGAEEEGTDDGTEFLHTLRDWLTEEAERHVHLGGFDSGYTEVSLWEHVTEDVAAIQPAVRMARLIIKLIRELEDEEGADHENAD